MEFNVKNLFRTFCPVLIIGMASLTFTACGDLDDVTWLVPMLSFTPTANTIHIFDGEIAVARQNIEGGPQSGQVTTSNITSASLLAGGAVRATARMEYDGSGDYLVQFRVRIDEFQGHGTGTVVANAAGDPNENPDRILVLWQDANGTWWDIRRARFGWIHTGSDGPHQFIRADGTPYTVNNAVRINRNTVSRFASVNFYIVVFDRPHHPNPTNDRSGYIITYFAEVPGPFCGHFHGHEILTSTTTPLVVHPPQE